MQVVALAPGDTRCFSRTVTNNGPVSCRLAGGGGYADTHEASRRGRDDATITVLGVKGNQVRVGINAPKSSPCTARRSMSASSKREQALAQAKPG